MPKALLAVCMCVALVTPSHAGLFGAWGRPKSKAKVSAVLTAFVGDVKVQKPGTKAWTRPAMRSMLGPGTAIATGANSEALVVFIDGTKMKLGSKALFKLETQKRKRTTVQLLAGKLQFWVKKIKGRQYRVRTPTAVAAIRGTGGSMGVDPQGDPLGDTSPAALNSAMDGLESGSIPSEAVLDLFNGSVDFMDNFGNSVNLNAGNRVEAQQNQPLRSDSITSIPPSSRMDPEPSGLAASVQGEVTKANNEVKKAKQAKAAAEQKVASAATPGAKAKAEAEAEYAEKQLTFAEAKKAVADKVQQIAEIADASVGMNALPPALVQEFNQVQQEIQEVKGSLEQAVEQLPPPPPGVEPVVTEGFGETPPPPPPDEALPPPPPPPDAEAQPEPDAGLPENPAQDLEETCDAELSPSAPGACP